MIKCQQLNILCFFNMHCHQLEIKEGQKRKNSANYTFLTLCRTKERGMELADGMDDCCLFLRQILHVLLTLEMLYERKHLMQTLKRLHLLQRYILVNFHDMHLMIFLTTFFWSQFNDCTCCWRFRCVVDVNVQFVY